MIPDEVGDDVDNDWIIEKDQKDEVIDNYLQGQADAQAALQPSSS